MNINLDNPNYHFAQSISLLYLCPSSSKTISRAHSSFISNITMALFLRSIQIAFESIVFSRLFPSLQLAGASTALPAFTLSDALQEAIWFAVPKNRITRSKKRMKTTAQKRIKLKQNIVTCGRTGEITLMHKLPFAWRDYIPGGMKKSGE